MNRMSATKMTRLRPRVLASWPEIGETKRAKREVEAAMRDLSTVLSSWEESEVPIETSVADMTPVSTVNTLVGSSKAIERKGVLTTKQSSTDTSRESQQPDEQRRRNTRILLRAVQSALFWMLACIFIVIVCILRHAHQRLLRSISHVVKGN